MQAEREPRPAAGNEESHRVQRAEPGGDHDRE